MTSRCGTTVRTPAGVAKGRGPGEGTALGDITLPAPGALDVEAEEIDRLVAEYATVGVAWEGTTDRVAEGLYSQHDPRPHRIHDLAPGRCLVRLSAGDMSIDEEVRIVAGESARVTFRLGRGEAPRGRGDGRARVGSSRLASRTQERLRDPRRADRMREI